VLSQEHRPIAPASYLLNEFHLVSQPRSLRAPYPSGSWSQAGAGLEPASPASGIGGNRTRNLCDAIAALSQLSYDPVRGIGGNRTLDLGGAIAALSHLSYNPVKL
jgi:hypothetical protein